MIQIITRQYKDGISEYYGDVEGSIKLRSELIGTNSPSRVLREKEKALACGEFIEFHIFDEDPFNFEDVFGVTTAY